MYDCLPEQVAALQEALNLVDKLPEQYGYGLIPEILPIKRSRWADDDEVTPTPEHVITWMEGKKLLIGFHKSHNPIGQF